MQYRCCSTAWRDSVCGEAAASCTASAIAMGNELLTQRIHDALVRGQIHCVFGQDRRGLQRAAEVRPPESLSGADVERLRPAVERLEADDGVARDRWGCERPQ